MASTKISDVIVPQVLASMASATISNFLDFEKTGVVVSDYNNVGITSGGNFAEVPFYNQLDGTDADEVLTDTTTLTPSKITTGKDIGVVCHRGKAWGSRDLTKILSGDDPAKEIAKQVGKYWAKRLDQTILQVLNANFAPTGPLGTGAASPHTRKVGTDAAAKTLFNAADALAAMQLLGDAMNDFDVIIMHSKVYTDMVNAQLVSFPYNYDPRTIDVSGKGRYMGKEIIVSDSCPVATATANYYYTTYFAKKGAIYLGRQKDLMTETDRDILAFEDVLSTSIHFVPHIKLCKWNQTITNPTNAQLATPTYWTNVAADHKFIGLAALQTN